MHFGVPLRKRRFYQEPVHFANALKKKVTTKLRCYETRKGLKICPNFIEIY